LNDYVSSNPALNRLFKGHNRIARLPGVRVKVVSLTTLSCCGSLHPHPECPLHCADGIYYDSKFDPCYNGRLSRFLEERNMSKDQLEDREQQNLSARAITSLLSQLERECLILDSDGNVRDLTYQDITRLNNLVISFKQMFKVDYFDPDDLVSRLNALYSFQQANKDVPDTHEIDSDDINWNDYVEPHRGGIVGIGGRMLFEPPPPPTTVRPSPFVVVVNEPKNQQQQPRKTFFFPAPPSPPSNKKNKRVFRSSSASSVLQAPISPSLLQRRHSDSDLEPPIKLRLTPDQIVDFAKAFFFEQIVD